MEMEMIGEELAGTVVVEEVKVWELEEILGALRAVRSVDEEEYFLSLRE